MKRVILITLAVLLIIATVVMTVMLYKKTKDQEEQITVLEEQIAQMTVEDLVDVYVAAKPIRAGTMAEETQLQLKSINRADLTPNMVTDPKLLIGKIWKIGVMANGHISTDMVAEQNYGPTDRLQLVSVDAMSPSLKDGDYVDIRMITPSGLNYVVMSKKRVNRIYSSGLEMVMSEAELMVYSGLVIDQFMHPGTIIYTSKYLEPTIQKSNYTMYVPPKGILDYMKVNANMIYPYLEADDVQGLRAYIENSQPWNLYGPSTFETETEAIIDRQSKVTEANASLAERMNAARAEYETAQEEGAAATTEATGEEEVVTTAEGTYIDSEGIERNADGSPVIQPTDLAPGLADVRE